LYKDFVSSHLIFNTPVVPISTIAELIVQKYLLYRTDSPLQTYETIVWDSTEESLKHLLRGLKNKPDPFLQTVVSSTFGNEAVARLFHRYNHTQQKYAYASQTSLRNHQEIVLPTWRKIAFDEGFSTNETVALCNQVKQEFRSDITYDTFISPNSYSFLKVYRSFLEGGFVGFWMDAKYTNRALAHRQKYQYQSYRGFIDSEDSDVHAINLVPVFSLTFFLLLVICFPAFLAEHLYKYFNGNDVSIIVNASKKKRKCNMWLYFRKYLCTLVLK